MKIWQTIRGYLFWTYERGTFHYDVMVTLILLFVFLSPRVVNFKDKPIEPLQHPTGVVVSTDATGGFVYQVEASAVSPSADSTLREALLRVIEPIAGEVDIVRIEPVLDNHGRVVAYKAWVRRS